jgi:hypothetical protein
LISQIISISGHKASLPHFLSLEIKDGEDGSSSSVKMNPDQVQCDICKEWFFKLAALQHHKSVLMYDCDECRTCFRDNIYHAVYTNHTRCFVKGCAAKERLNYGFLPEMINAHIRVMHPD